MFSSPKNCITLNGDRFDCPAAGAVATPTAISQNLNISFTRDVVKEP